MYTVVVLVLGILIVIAIPALVWDREQRKKN